jgi:glucosamine--fructose-6-phosphate aminotransferase (isomerizing)
MTTNNTLTEIESQPEVWQQILDLCEQQKSTKLNDWISHEHPVLTGSGSSWYLGVTAAAFFTQLTRRRALAVSASEVCTSPESIFSAKEKYACLAVSRNGKSAETVNAARWFNESQSTKTVIVTTVPSSPLLDVCEPGLLLSPAAEKSRYMTRSFTGPLLALQYLIASATGHDEMVKELRRLPELCARVLESCRGTVKSLAEEKHFEHYVGLGQGPFFGLAAEAMLKVTEMVIAPAAAYPSLELMHGPNYLLSNKTLVTLFHAASARAYEIPLLDRIKAKGASIFAICDQASPELHSKADFIFETSSGLSELASLLLMMPVMQLYAYYRARHTGNPLE